jgi:hypothetical protein
MSGVSNATISSISKRNQSMNNRNNYMILPMVLALTSLLIADTASAQRSGQSMSVQTGIVIGAQAVNLQSAAGRGAAVGGVVGLAATSSNRSTSRRLRNTAIGAGTGALIARNAQGSLDGMQYTIEVGPGSQIIVVTDQTQVRVGDCVNVEQAGAGTANVRRVSDAMCEAAFANAVDDDIRAEYTQLADMCLDAKQRMLKAETDEAFDLAVRRMNMLCDD